MAQILRRVARNFGSRHFTIFHVPESTLNFLVDDGEDILTDDSGEELLAE